MAEDNQLDRSEQNGKGGRRRIHPYGPVKYTWEAFVAENPSWESIMLELAQDGEGKTSWMVYLGLNHRTFNRFIEEPEFIEAVEKAEMLELMYWERECRRMVSGDSTRFPGAGKGNAFALSLIMRNRFGWETKGPSSETKLLNAPECSESLQEYSGEDLESELISRGLPTNLFNNFNPEPIDYGNETVIEGQFSEGNKQPIENADS